VLEGPWFSDRGRVGIGSRVEGVIIGIRTVFFFFILIFILILILSWRSLSRARTVIFIRGNGRGRVSMLPEGWR
jgi:hypothetical protein